MNSDMHVKMVPYKNNLDDIRVDATVGKMIDIIVSYSHNLMRYKDNFLKYVCSANMYVKPNDLRIPYKKMFKTNERCNSILFDTITQSTPANSSTSLKKSGYFNEYIYTKCIVNRAINGQSLDFYIRISTDDQFANFLLGDQFYKMCKGMYKLGKHFGFVHNDAHTGNVFVEDVTGNCILIDYGRSYINIADNAKYIIEQENTKHELPIDSPLYDYDFPFIKSELPQDKTGKNLADWLPVMCDIACLSYNIWKRASNMSHTKIKYAIDEINKVFKLDGNVFLDPDVKNVNANLHLTTLSPNMRVISAGLMWMRCYIETALPQGGYINITNIPLADIEGTPNAPDRILWNAGQIQPRPYNAIKNIFNNYLDEMNMGNWIKIAFDDLSAQYGGRLNCPEIETEKECTNALVASIIKSLNESLLINETIDETINDKEKLKDIIDKEKLKDIIEASFEESCIMKKKQEPQDIETDENELSNIRFNGYSKPLGFTANLVDKPKMLNNYSGYHQYSIAFAVECLQKLACERGTYC
jgi:frataxin-like iron-binding protein CyaY